MGDEHITPSDADELASCFAANAGALFGYACALTRGDRALSGDLVQDTFEAAGRDWAVFRDLGQEDRCGWLRRTVANIAVGLRREAAFRDRRSRVDGRSKKTPDGPVFSPGLLERCGLLIAELSERQHAIALMRWQLDMKEAEIAEVLGVGETTVRSTLDRVEGKMTVLLDPGGAIQDAVPSLYQQVIRVQETQFRAGYDVEAGLGRYQGWLAEQAGPEQAGSEQAGSEQAGSEQAGSEQAGSEQAGSEQAATAGRPEWSAELALVELYSLHYKPLVRLAAVLLRDTQTAEEVVQEAFIAMHDGWQRLKDPDKALAYLRQAVVNRSRSVLRHRMVVDKNAPKPAPDMPSAEHGAMAAIERSEVVTALRGLPERQREAIILRYYLDLSEADIAAAMGISRGAVKSHTARAMAALRAALENPPD